MNGPPPSRPLETLRRFARSTPRIPAQPGERCELCGAGLGNGHQHLLEPAARKLVCACDACAVLFGGQTKYKRVPRRVWRLPDFRIGDSQWDGLMMPINLAFFFKSTPHGRTIAMYPSPAGATESLLPLDTWQEIEAANPALAALEPDVEALLANRIGHIRGFAGPEYYVVPIDECYKLVGLIRARWQGLSGGAAVWEGIAQFFSGLQDRAGLARDELAAQMESHA